MRLIDADELRKQMYHQAFETDTDMQRWDSGCWIRYKMFENAIESAPTIDPVKHGRWIDVNGDGSLWQCSLCGEQSCCKGNYCMDCGAYMLNEEEEDEAD